MQDCILNGSTWNFPHKILRFHALDEKKETSEHQEKGFPYTAFLLPIAVHKKMSIYQLCIA
jgi:hypothetical protein